ncbi:MAG: tetratricopeptide repeat protein [bacterium]
MGLNGIYPVNLYPYNIQFSKKTPVKKVSPEAEGKQTPSDNAEFSDNKQSSGYKQTIDYSVGKVNISQIVNDFKNTLTAIGASKDVNEEVETYLKLVELQSAKENPSQKIIKSNLTNAAALLDGYITETLNKPSEVVKNWIDAILLQKVDYKSDKPVTTDNNFINNIEKPSQILTTPVSQQIDSSAPVKNDNITKANRPEDTKLEELYKKTEQIVDSGNFEEALSVYEKLIPLSQKFNNTEVETKLYMDKAYIHDESGDYIKALESYNKAANIAFNTGNQEIQSKAHYNMASIYDDFGKLDAALSHYYESISLDGQVDNLKGQSITLNDVGNVYVSKYEYKEALGYFKVGFSLTKEIGDSKGQACILSNTAGVFRDLGYDDKAIKYYKDSIKIDTKIGNVEGYAKSFEQAGDIMLRNDYKEKAQNLYRKSLFAAQKVGDHSWSAKILDKLQLNSFSY